MMRQFELVDRVTSYDPKADEDLLNRAYVFATKMHGDQKRASGDPYFSHPVEVAGILTDLRLDTQTIATGLLHDTLEDTDATFNDIVSMFGGEVADLVDGVTKLSKLEMVEGAAAQAENFRKLLLATSNDIRVLLVKLADRLHNMRTLHFIPSAEKRRRIAQETIEIYAPLAGRMGMQNFREEYEDLAFEQLNPEARRLVLDRLDQLDATHGAILDDIAYEIGSVLGRASISAQVKGRRKRPFSIWRKMQHKSISLEQLSDIFGYRIIVDNEDLCYRALGAIHRAYKVVPGRFKDYISVPKLNNYQSLHTTVIGPDRQRVEVQIRTEMMHQVAERGVAAHWAYKEGDGFKRPNVTEIQPFSWLQEVVNQLKTGESAEEFLENTKLELFTDQVFCFTPKGRLIALPDGATVLDFAFAVHTEVGTNCGGARINGKPVPLRQRINNGDEIEIIRDPAIMPQQIWLNHVVTGKARAAIRHALRRREDAEYATLGERLVRRLFEIENTEPSRDILERALGIMDFDSLPELYAEIGRGRVAAADVLFAVLPKKRPEGLTRTILSGARRAFSRSERRQSTAPIPLSAGMSGVAMKFAPSCFPLPGDPIVGILTSDVGLMVYPLNAPQLADFEEQPERWVAMRWDIAENEDCRFASRLSITVNNQPGSLGAVAQTIADFDANITNLGVYNRDDNFYDLIFDIQARDVNHVQEIIDALKGARSVAAIRRIVFDKEEK